MNKQEMYDIATAIINIRNVATDEQALAAQALYPVWKSDANYVVGERVRYGDILYKVLQEHTSQDDWKPDVSSSLFAKVLIPDENVIYAWEQPDSTNPYMTGDKVAHNGKIWISTCDNNVWEPSVYGWEEVVE